MGAPMQGILRKNSKKFLDCMCRLVGRNPMDQDIIQVVVGINGACPNSENMEKKRAGRKKDNDFLKFSR